MDWMCPVRPRDYPTRRSPWSMGLVEYEPTFELPWGWLDEELQGIDNRAGSAFGRTLGVVSDQDKFRIELDTKDFKPEELNVRCVKDRYLVVEGKHEETRQKEGPSALAAKEFKRCYMIPRGVDPTQLKSKLIGEVLTIEGPKTQQQEISHERPIAIEQG